MRYGRRFYDRRYQWPERRPQKPRYDPLKWSGFGSHALCALRQACPSLPFKWLQPLAARACALVLEETVPPWPLWRKTGPGAVYGPSITGAVSIPITEEEVVQALARLRADFMWLNLRRRRMYDRPLPHHAFDVDFCAWLRSLDQEAVLTFARCFLGAWPEGAPVEHARARLALLRPMPLALLWPAHVFKCARTDVLAGCETMDDVRLEYITLFAAVHACRALAEFQRAHARRYQFPPELWAPRQSRDESPESYAKRMLDEADLQLLPRHVVEAFVRIRVEAEAEQGKPRGAMHWQPVLGPKCRRCQGGEEAVRLAGREALEYRLAGPPFRAGCTCEFLFDPENDPFMEAPWEEDVARWVGEWRQAAEFPGIRVVLASY